MDYNMYPINPPSLTTWSFILKLIREQLLDIVSPTRSSSTVLSHATHKGKVS